MMRVIAVLAMFAAVGNAIPDFLVIGFRHILPDGVDHMLFILGLFLLTREFAPLLLQMTLFTLAHSLTLGLTLYGMVSLPERIVEIAIALSIAFIAVENLFIERLSRWRPWVVFGFGLIHGLGFAHSFDLHRMDESHFLPALFSFNLGIELGQIAVVAIAFTVVSLWWKRDFYQKLIARPASALIAASGLYLALERGF